jgi:sigma-E factor negative regulatory protein RseC
MSDKHQIEHEGIVEHIDGNIARVRILAKSACASCHANGACPAADMQEKLIDASCDRPYNAGDKVLLIGDNKYGFLAAWWAYVLPLILMLFTLS